MMKYALITPSGPGTALVLKRKYGLQRFLGITLLVIGIPVFLSGLLLMTAGGEDMHPHMLGTGLGLFLLSAGVLVFTQVRLPDTLTFDNDQSALVIKEKGRAGGVVQVPYSDIAGFHVRLHRQDRSAFYAVEMEKKDGACWSLLFFGTEGAARDACAILNEGVKLDAPAPLQAPPVSVPGDISLGERDGVSVISWKKRQPFISLTSGYAIIAGFSMTIYGIALLSDNRIAYYLAVAFAAVIAALAVFFFFYNINRRYFVEVGRGVFRYYTTGLLFHGLRFERPVMEIDSIIFNFSALRGETALYVLSRKERETLIAINRGDVQLGDILGAVGFMAKVPRVDTGHLGIAGKLRLEGIIQNAVREKSGRSGL